MNKMFESLQQAVEDSYPNLSGVLECMVLEEDIGYQAFEAALFGKKDFNALDPANPDDTDLIIADQASQFATLLHNGLSEVDEDLDEEVLTELEIDDDGIDEDLGEDRDTEDIQYASGIDPVFEAVIADLDMIAMEARMNKKYARIQYGDRALKIKKSLIICARAVKKNKPERALRTLKVMIRTFERMAKLATKRKNDADGIAYLTALRDLRAILRAKKMDQSIFKRVISILYKARVIDHKVTDEINRVIAEMNERGVTESFIEVEDADDIDLALEGILNALDYETEDFISMEEATDTDAENIDDDLLEDIANLPNEIYNPFEEGFDDFDDSII